MIEIPKANNNKAQVGRNLFKSMNENKADTEAKFITLDNYKSIYKKPQPGVDFSKSKAK